MRVTPVNPVVNLAAVAIAALLLAGCEPPAEQEVAAVAAVESVAPASEFETEIRWTRYGIPHVKATDWRGLGYGFSYATARDGLCVIARELVLLDGEMSLHFGSSEEHLASDIFHKAILQPPRLSAFSDSESTRSAEFSRGYVRGYNRYLKDNAGRLPADCNNQAWVREMTAGDVARMTIGVGIRYGLGRVQKEMAFAEPPSAGAEQVSSLATDFEPPRGYGSNAVALGRAVTESGRGILFGNPHYPWSGPSRFHMIHTTIPGELDVMGVGLLTTSRVALGFNKDVAWSHTVSTALRSTFYELELNPENPMQYRYGEGFRDIESLVVSVEETAESGAVTVRQQPVYFTHYGPLVQSEALPWTTSKAYTIRDANLANMRTGDTYDALNKASTIDEVEAAISLQGVSWTNTIAADREGTAFYADISVTPNVDMDLLSRCQLKPEGIPARAVVLKGSDPACEWKEDARSAIPGALPAEEMPRLRREDYVSNSNDSYWLSNPQQPLEGYSPIIGNERKQRTLRTRAGLVFLEELLTQDHKFTPDDMQQMIYSQRNFGAELLLDDLLELCSADMPAVAVDDSAVDVRPGCKVLRAWDRRMASDSRGGHLWREFWRKGQKIDNVFATPFDVADPVHTPNGLAVSDPEVRAQLLQALAGAQRVLGEANIALDAPLGEIQYKAINGERIPVPGGEGWAGMWSMIRSRLVEGEGYTPILHGNSYIQVISWDKAGKLDARAILTYSQSPEPDSPHSTDMTHLYAKGGWVDLPFTEEEISADPELETLHLAE